MGRCIISLSRHTSTRSIVNTQLDRIESITGTRPVDWLSEVEGLAIEENDLDDGFDWDSYAMQIESDADNYIDFIQTNYPELIRC